MLSDHERETLREVQRQLTAEDPGFARSFDAVGRDSTFSFDWVHSLPRWAYTTVLVVTVALAGLMMVSRAPWLALLFIMLIPVIALLRRRNDGTDRQDE